MCDDFERGLLRRVFDLGYQFGLRDLLKAEREAVNDPASNVIRLEAKRSDAEGTA
jgi:hypothetical protein